AAWSLTISPSPSYDGSYTVSFPLTLGCQPGGPAPNVTVCYALHEVDPSGNHTSWGEGSGPITFSGKSAGTYRYYIDYHYYSPWGSGYEVLTRATVEVILPKPVLNASYYPSGGPANNPSGYFFGWNATNAHSNQCNLILLHYRQSTLLAYEEHLQNLPTSYTIHVPKLFSDAMFTIARLTCHGPGGATTEEHNL